MFACNGRTRRKDCKYTWQKTARILCHNFKTNGRPYKISYKNGCSAHIACLQRKSTGDWVIDVSLGIWKEKVDLLVGAHILSSMPVSEVALQRVLAILADEDQLKVTVRASGYGGVVAGVTTTIGGLIAGPAGLLVGGALGGVLAYANAGDFKPVSQVVKEMNAHERQLLYNAMRDIVDNLAIEDYVALLAFLNGGAGLLIRQQLMERMSTFLRDQMRLQMAA